MTGRLSCQARRRSRPNQLFLRVFLALRGASASRSCVERSDVGDGRLGPEPRPKFDDQRGNRQQDDADTIVIGGPCQADNAPILNPQDSCDDPASAAAVPRNPGMDNDVIIVRNNQAGLVP